MKGKNTTELLPEIIETALGRLPISKRMRWGDSDIEYVLNGLIPAKKNLKS